MWHTVSTDNRRPVSGRLRLKTGSAKQAHKKSRRAGFSKGNKRNETLGFHERVGKRKFGIICSGLKPCSKMVLGAKSGRESTQHDGGHNPAFQ
jgi:hypothetical protein